MSSNLFRVVLGHLAKVAVPAVALNPGKYPHGSLTRPQLNNPAYRNYWNFLKEHEVELSDEESGAINRYRNNSSRINTYLRTGEDTGTWGANKELDLHKDIKHLDNAISKSWMKRPVQIWRSITVAKGEPITEKLNSLGLLDLDRWDSDPWYDNPVGKLKQSDLDNLIGFKFEEPAFASSSMSRQVMPNLEIRLLILLDRGQNGLVLNSYNEFDSSKKTLREDAGMGNKYSHEHEILLPRDTVFQVEKATLRGTEDGSQIVIKVRVLD